MEIFKKVDVIVTPTTGYACIMKNYSRNSPNCNGPLYCLKFLFNWYNVVWIHL